MNDEKEYETQEAERLSESHRHAIEQAKYKGKAIISPGSQLRMTIISIMTGGIVAMSLTYPFFHDNNGTWMFLVYALIGIVGAIVSLFFYSHWFVVDESLDKRESVFEYYTAGKTVKDMYFKKK